MNNQKREKIQAKLDHHSTPEHEKDVCRKILEGNPINPKDRTFYNPSDPDFNNQPSLTFEELRVGLSWDDIISESSTMWLKVKKTDLYSHYCNQCDNYFADGNQKSLYCPICLEVKRKEVG